MRYVRKEHIITTVCDENITDMSVIEKLLERLKKDAIEFSLGFQKVFTSDYSKCVINHKRTVINKINKDKQTVDFFVFQKGTTTVLNNINIKDIVEITAITSSGDLLQINPEADRFHLMNIEKDIL